MITEEEYHEDELQLSDITFDSDDCCSESASSMAEEPSADFLHELDLLNKLGPAGYVAFQRQSAKCPQDLFKFFGADFPDGITVDSDTMWGMLERLLLRHYYERQCLPINGLEGFINSLKEAKNIVIVMGAGLSVSCGVPDFRSPKTGLYSMIRDRFPSLGAPEDIFDLELFREDARPFYAIAKELIAKSLTPSPAHHFIKWLEAEGKILRVFTQNIDCLESKVGLEKVCYCHGSFLTSTCLQCRQKYTLAELLEFLEECKDSVPTCSCNGVIKPDIVFFGESLPEHFDFCVASELQKADLFIVMGSSMKVHPVSALPDLMNPSIPQFLINKTPIYDHNYDLQLLGDADNIVSIVTKFMISSETPAHEYQPVDKWLVFPGAIIEEAFDSSDHESSCEEQVPLQSAEAAAQ